MVECEKFEPGSNLPSRHLFCIFYQVLKARRIPNVNVRKVAHIYYLMEEQ